MKRSLGLICVVLVCLVLACDDGDGIVEPPAGSIQGTVLDARSGDPVAFATFHCDGRTCESDANGVYVLSDVAPGLRTIAVTSRGYETYTHVVHVGGPVTRIDIRLIPSGPRTGSRSDFRRSDLTGP